MAQKDIDVQANGTHASAPSPAEGFEVLLITGMSGAGRSHAADSIEDMVGMWLTTCLQNCWCPWWT